MRGSSGSAQRLRRPHHPARSPSTPDRERAQRGQRLPHVFALEPHRHAPVLIRRHPLAPQQPERVPAADGGIDAGLLEEIVRVARSRRAAFVRLEPDLAQDDPRSATLDAVLRAAGFRTAEKTIQPRSTVVLDLAPPLSELFSGVSKGHRGNVKRTIPVVPA